MGHLISIIALAYLIYVVGGGLIVLTAWICSKWHRFGITAVLIGLFSAWIYSLPDPPPLEYSYSAPAPVAQETKIKYVTLILGKDSNDERIEKRITLEECKALPEYRGVVYGICEAQPRTGGL